MIVHLLLHCILLSATVTAALSSLRTKDPLLPVSLPSVNSTGRVPPAISALGIYSLSFVHSTELRNRINLPVSSPSPIPLSRSVFIQQRALQGWSPLFACRPRPKKEKALRNYRIAKQQRQNREERAAQRRQELEVARARQHLLSPSEASPRSERSSSATGKPDCRGNPFEANHFSATTGEAEGLPPELRGHLAARINYRLVGGTWRRARGAAKFIRLPGAQMAAAIFSGLPEEEVAAAVAKAKRQDAGHMDLEAYDESDTAQLTTLEGMS